MPKTTFKFLIQIICVLMTMGCGPKVEVGYQPPIVPVRVSINTDGELNLDLSYEFVTPVGTFDLGGSTTVYSIRNQYADKVLVVRVDDQVVVYQLEEGKEFKVTFDERNTLYRRVALDYESDGDIILELESVQSISSSEEEQVQTNGEAQLADPEDFIRDYFYAIVHARNYDYLWTLSTDQFKEKNSKGSYQDYVSFWNTVDSLDLELVDFYERDSLSARCRVKMTLFINGNDYPLDLRYHLIYDSNKQTWIFESP